MKASDLKQHEQTLINALRLAAEVYVQDANLLEAEQPRVAAPLTKRAIYCTSFCNFGHCLDNGRPVAHECYVIPPDALKIEREQGAAVALESDEWRRFYANIGRAVRDK